MTPMTTNEGRLLCGILLLTKPEGISSARAVAVAKRAFGGVKVGHLGTLDPFASGLLPLAVGEGTKLAPYLADADKRYRGVVRLGVTSDTLDRTGQILEERAVPGFDETALRSVESQFLGASLQVPPLFSAIKKSGVPMYRRARRGEAPEELDPRPVTIHTLELARLDETRVLLDVHCSKGTYVRSLARDIGARLGTVALLESLVRTAFGPFSLEQGLDLAVLETGSRPPLEGGAWIPGVDAIGHLRCFVADEQSARGLRAGQQRALAAFAPPAEAETHARVVDPGGRLVAVLARTPAGSWAIDRVFA